MTPGWRGKRPHGALPRSVATPPKRKTKAQTYQEAPVISGGPDESGRHTNQWFYLIADEPAFNSVAVGPLWSDVLLRKEVIQPHLPVRLPCYDLTPITDPTFDGSFLTVRPPASGVADFRGVTGGVYKARERIHPGVLIRDY